MAERDRVVETADERTGAKLVAPTTRVSVAFPISHLHIEESSKDLAELVRILVHHASVVGGLAPGPEVEKLRDAADALAAKFE